MNEINFVFVDFTTQWRSNKIHCSDDNYKYTHAVPGYCVLVHQYILESYVFYKRQLKINKKIDVFYIWRPGLW